MKKALTLLRSFFYQANLNHENMQGSGFLFLLKNFYKDNGIEVSKEILDEESKYFHTHPFLINFILGMWIKEHKDGKDPKMYKKTYSSAFGALGDSFFWHALRPLSFIISALFFFIDPLLSLVAYFLFFNIFHLSFLFAGLEVGLSLGKDIIVWFNRINFNKWPAYFDLSTVFLLGVFLAMLLKENFHSKPDLYFISAIFMIISLMVAKKVDIVLAIIIHFFVSGVFLLFLGV